MTILLAPRVDAALGLPRLARPAAFHPAYISGLLAEYDFLKSGSELSTVLYDRKPGGGANGTIGSGGTYSAQGFTPGGSAGWAATPVANNAAGTVLFYLTPEASSGTTMAGALSGVGTPSAVWFDCLGDMPQGQVYPRFTDPSGHSQPAFGYSTAAWPLSVGVTLGTPAKLYLNGVPASIYDVQWNGSDFARSSAPWGFGNNFTSTATAPSLYRYALLFSGVLSDALVLACHGYMAAKVALRNPATAGPAVLTGNLLVMQGNSIVNLMDTAQITPTVTFSKLKTGLTGADPAQIVTLGRQAVIPLKRPLAPRNYCYVWPTANVSSLSQVSANIAPWCQELRAAGWKVALGTSISHSGADTIKNQVNAYYDSIAGTAAQFWDRLVDYRGVPEVSADGAYANATYYSDGTHPTTGATGSNTGYGKMYPVLTAAINAMG